MNKAGSSNTETITARIPLNVKETIEYASALCVATVNQFMVQAALKEAEDVIQRNQEMESIVLSARDRQHVWDLSENPPEPNDKLIEAFKQHKAFFSEQD